MGVPEQHTLGIVRLSDGSTEDDLKSARVNVLRSRYGFAFVSMPVDDVERVASLKSVKRLQLARPVKAKMLNARKSSGVENIHQGIGLEQAYTGKGVVCGIVDTGLDPNHINFLDSEGKSRVGFLGHLTINQNATSDADLLKEKFYDRESMANFTTDDRSTYHGTHTMGTMAGGYRGTATVAIANSDLKTSTLEEMPNPYYGVAYDADIAAACGDLYDAIIAYGVDYIIQYAEQQGKPYVINLSLGSNSGPHDGKGLIDQFFDACAEEANAIICVAAGNEGDMKIALNKILTAEDTEVKTFIEGYDYNNGSKTTYTRAGSVAIYSNDETPFTVTAVIYNNSRNRVAKTYGVETQEEMSTGKYWVSSSNYQESDADIEDMTLGTYFDGYIGIGGMVDEDSKRYYAVVDYQLFNNTVTNADGTRTIGFIVTGSEGQRIDVFCDGEFSWLRNNGIDGWEDGSTNGTISDMATGNNILAVGSYNTSSYWGCVDGQVYTAAYNISSGEITEFSSYGTLIDGRNLPHVCAPGAAIISSYNRYYTPGTSEVAAKVSGEVRDNN